VGIRCFNIWNVSRVYFISYKRHPPFYDIEPTNIYKKILNGVIEFPKFLHVRAKDVIRKLLNSDVNKRLGVEDVNYFN
jgi:protein kinase A/protein kinase X